VQLVVGDAARMIAADVDDVEEARRSLVLSAG
jgi:hypothetical protein